MLNVSKRFRDSTWLYNATMDRWLPLNCFLLKPLFSFSFSPDKIVEWKLIAGCGTSTKVNKKSTSTQWLHFSLQGRSQLTCWVQCVCSQMGIQTCTLHRGWRSCRSRGGGLWSRARHWCSASPRTCRCLEDSQPRSVLGGSNAHTPHMLCHYQGLCSCPDTEGGSTRRLLCRLVAHTSLGTLVERERGGELYLSKTKTMIFFSSKQNTFFLKPHWAKDPKGHPATTVLHYLTHTRYLLILLPIPVDSDRTESEHFTVFCLFLFCFFWQRVRCKDYYVSYVCVVYVKLRHI